MFAFKKRSSYKCSYAEIPNKNKRNKAAKAAEVHATLIWPEVLHSHTCNPQNNTQRVCREYRGKQRLSICGFNLSRLKYAPSLVFMKTSSTFVRKTHPHTFRLWERLNMHISDIDECNGPQETPICWRLGFLSILRDISIPSAYRNDLKCCSISWTGWCLISN